MSKRIALGVASALLGITGVAGANMALTSSGNIDSDHQSAGVSFLGDDAGLGCALAVGVSAADANCGSSAPGLSTATNLLGGLPGTSDVLGEAAGIQGTAEELLDTVAGALPVNDVTGMLDAVPSVCDALPMSIPMPARTMGNALSLFGQAQSLIGQQLAMVASLAPSTPTVLSAPDLLNKVKGELSCAGAGSDGSLPVDLPVELDVCAVNAGVVNGLPAPVNGAVAGAIADATAATGLNVSSEGNTLAVQCDSSKLPVPASIQSTTIQSRHVTPKTKIAGLPVPAVSVPAVKVDVPVVGPVEIPAVDISSGIIPSITVGPISTPAVSIPALPLGSLLGGSSAGASANGGGLLGSIFSGLLG